MGLGVRNRSFCICYICARGPVLSDFGTHQSISKNRSVTQLYAHLILHELGEFLGYSPPPLLDRLIEDAQKVHKQRPVLQETLATATQPRCEA